MYLPVTAQEIGPAHSVDGRSRQQRLYELLRRAILDGRLIEGETLPSTRELADSLKIARNSVIFAYEQLKSEGFLVVNKKVTQIAVFENHPKRSANKNKVATLPRLSKRGQSISTQAVPIQYYLPFAPGIPDVEHFPFNQWAKCIQYAWKTVGAQHLSYSSSGGEQKLKESITHFLRHNRGLNCSPEQILITGGTQMAIDFCGQVLADPSEKVWIENPGYFFARKSLETSGLSIIPVDIDSQGMLANQTLWEKETPRLIFVTPSHQYPLGSVMSLQRRLELLKGAKKYRAWIIEDDYDSEFNYLDTAITPLQELDPTAPVIYLGTFSKSLYPSLKIGYMVLPKWAVDSLAPKYTHLYRQGQGIEQLALARFIESGELDRHIKGAREIYRKRKEVLNRELIKAFNSQASVLGGNAGTHLTLVFNQKIDDKSWAKKANALGIAVKPLSDFYIRPNKAKLFGLVIGYGSTNERMIPRLVRQLKDIVVLNDID